MTRQSGWRERAADPKHPLYLRIAFLAYGSCRANGHAVFTEGELAHLFDTPPNRISDALRVAKQRGMLSRESRARCLVVPPEFIYGGLGNVFERCAVHDGKRVGTQRFSHRLVELGQPQATTDTRTITPYGAAANDSHGSPVH
jgi:hypothetical protein